ncbi:hypothetical protein EUTSA_v10022191mg [Eutrema salsugineum]|uniref:Uncharacterized protein n=1 Tax=Eutrema salsugineum TaxID=72664 RepID=V4LEI9_EUTSA|nr:hypothetical protein EUTSA_v10022191mg [Eutrema salsugineum]
MTATGNVLINGDRLLTDRREREKGGNGIGDWEQNRNTVSKSSLTQKYNRPKLVFFHPFGFPVYFAGSDRRRTFRLSCPRTHRGYAASASGPSNSRPSERLRRLGLGLACERYNKSLSCYLLINAFCFRRSEAEISISYMSTRCYHHSSFSSSLAARFPL